MIRSCTSVAWCKSGQPSQPGGRSVTDPYEAMDFRADVLLGIGDADIGPRSDYTPYVLEGT